MERRGFIGAVAGAIAGLIGGKAVSETAKPNHSLRLAYQQGAMSRNEMRRIAVAEEPAPMRSCVLRTPMVSGQLSVAEVDPINGWRTYIPLYCPNEAWEGIEVSQPVVAAWLPKAKVYVPVSWGCD